MKKIIFNKLKTLVLYLYAVKILIINGPNLNLLGQRNPEVYGNQSFDEYFEELKTDTEDIELEYFQSNIEGEIVEKLQLTKADGILLNAGGFTHTSVAIADAIEAIEAPVIEVHISNPAAREPYRHTSLIAAHVIGSIAGFGLESYWIAILAFQSFMDVDINEN